MADEFWSKKSDIERAIMAGIHGAPELRKAERDQLLGEFAERVLVAITKDQVTQDQLDRKVVKAAKNPKATGIVVSAEVPYGQAHKYSELAEEHKLTFTMRDDPAYVGDVGLVVVSDPGES
jgi:uncharacterized protein YueI